MSAPRMGTENANRFSKSTSGKHAAIHLWCDLSLSPMAVGKRGSSH